MGAADDLALADIKDLLSVKLTALNPVGIGHMHDPGESMFGYTFHAMAMDGNRSGTTLVTSEEVLTQFMVAPESMDMTMHMIEFMHGWTEEVTIMAMTSHVENEMELVTRMGESFSTRSAGWGDLNISALIMLRKDERTRIHATLGISLPTGSIDKRGTTPMGPMRLPYPMQLGSGTYDLQAGCTYLASKANWFWGGELATTLRLSENANDYRLGNRISGRGWLTRQWTDAYGTTIELTAERWGDIHGQDPLLNPMMTPTADPKRRGGRRIDFRLLQTAYVADGPLKGTRLAVWGSLPVHQNLRGPQLEVDWQFGLQLKHTF